jgi:hypothetical protein
MLIGWALFVIIVGAQSASPTRTVFFEARTSSTNGAAVPAGDVLVVVRPPSGAPTTGLTDAKGQLILTSIPLGPVTVLFGPPNCTLKSETYSIDESTGPIQLSVQPSALLRVEVSAASFAGHTEVPLAGAAVTLRRGPRDAMMYLTDASGVASSCVEPGVAYDVRVDCDGMATAARYGVKLEAGGRLDVPIRLVPLRVER